MPLTLHEKEQVEIDYWKNSNFESDDSFTVDNFLNKAQELKHFNYKVLKYKHQFSTAQSILEVGAGQGWASCFLKRFYNPKADYTVSDISPYAINSLAYWEEVFNVSIDSKLAAKSYDIAVGEKRFDLIFCYAAAHHFVRYKETLTELKRLLKPEGKILFLYEPVSSKLLYPLYYRYVNAMPHSTPEDVLVPKSISRMAEALELECQVSYDPNQSINRGVVVTIYFFMLRKLRFLNSLVPSSADFVFSRK